jgi:hypothetical protein
VVFAEGWGSIPQYLLGAGDSYSASCFYFLALASYCIFFSGYLYRLEKILIPDPDRMGTAPGRRLARAALL